MRLLPVAHKRSNAIDVRDITDGIRSCITSQRKAADETVALAEAFLSRTFSISFISGYGETLNRRQKLLMFGLIFANSLNPSFSSEHPQRALCYSSLQEAQDAFPRLDDEQRVYVEKIPNGQVDGRPLIVLRSPTGAANSQLRAYVQRKGSDSVCELGDLGGGISVQAAGDGQQEGYRDLLVSGRNGPKVELKRLCFDKESYSEQHCSKRRK